MHHARSILVTAIFVSLLAGCSSSPTMQATSEGEVPVWFTSPPQDPNYLFAPSTATSQDLQLAIDKATVSGRAEIGRQLEAKVTGMQKRFEEETGVGQDAQLLQQFTQAAKTVTSTSLSGSRVKSQKQVKDGSMWRSYVLVEYPLGAANQALMQSIKANQQLYTRFRATEAFKDLDTEVQKYEEAKKQQIPPSAK